MKKLFFLSIIAISAITFANAQPADGCAKPDPYIEVRGYAKTMITPNKAEITIVLNQADDKGRSSMEDMESQLAKALSAAGVDAATQLKLSDQTSEAYKRKKALQFKRYVLTVNSSEEMQNVFSAFEDYTIKNATVTRVWYDKEEEVNKALKIEAIKNARETAKSLVEAIGQNIGKAIFIQDFSYGSNEIVRTKAARYSVMAESADSLASELPIADFEPIKVERTITVRFLLP